MQKEGRITCGFDLYEGLPGLPSCERNRLTQSGCKVPCTRDSPNNLLDLTNSAFAVYFLLFYSVLRSTLFHGWFLSAEVEAFSVLIKREGFVEVFWFTFM